jgi:hypothetical protein
MTARKVTTEQREHLDDLHRLVLDALCRRYPDKWEIVDSDSTSKEFISKSRK